MKSLSADFLLSGSQIVGMPTSLLNRGTMNPASLSIDDQRAYQLALELSRLGLNGHGQSLSFSSDIDQLGNTKLFSRTSDHNIYEYEDQDESVYAVNLRKSNNMTETVPVPSSEHVAEIVGRQGCKIKALRAKTNTYIKTPVRGAEPVFVVTGRREDVAQAKREILSAAEHFSQIRASRRNGTTSSSGSSSPTSNPGHVTIQVRVPYKVVGLVVGPKGATIKRIQQSTSTYIVTPGRDKEPVFEVTGLPDNVDKAREEIEKHIATRTGSDSNADLHIDDFHANGIDSGFHDNSGDECGVSANFTGYNNTINLQDNLPVMITNKSYPPVSQCNSAGAHLKISDFPVSQLTFPTCDTFAPSLDDLIGPNGNTFDAAAIWGESTYSVQRSNSLSMSSRLPSIEDPHPRTRRTNSDPLAAAFQRIEVAFNSSSPTSSQGSMSPVGSRRNISPTRRGCLLCGGDVTAALVPCGHNSFCIACAREICEREVERRHCPICHISPTQAIRIRCT